MSIVRLLRRHWLLATTIATFLIIISGIMFDSLQRTTAPILPVVGKAYDFSLVNSNGQRVTLDDSAGKVRLVAFIYTRCTTICPATTSEMVKLQKSMTNNGLIGNRVELISITIDPKFDTEAILRKYKEEFGASSTGWEFLTGTQPSIDQTLKKYGVYAMKISKTQYVHTVAEFLIDERGNIRKVYGTNFLESGVENDIETLARSE